MGEHAIRLTVTDDRARMRLAVFFRLILVLPHAVVLFFWSLGALVVAVVNWLATLFMGRSPDALHGFLARYARYFTHVSAYFFLLADEYPLFSGRPGYPVDLEIDPPLPQPRWSTFLRPLLAIPALAVASALTGGGGGSGNSGNSGGTLQVVAFLGWFASLVRGEMPAGMRDLGAYSLGYSAQTWGYLFLLTDRYPNSDPARIGSPEPLPEHPVRMSVDDDRRRSRLTVFFRLLLAIPHFVWLFLWGIAALVAVIANWVMTLVSGRPPESLHGFIVKYVRYQLHVWAYLTLVTNRFPGFAGEPYDVDVEIAPPEPQNRWVTAFRIIMMIPAVMIGGALWGAIFVVAMLGWFASLITAEMPEGLRNLGAYGLRYSAQVSSYAYVLTDVYPYSGPPASPGQREALPEPEGSELDVASTT